MIGIIGGIGPVAGINLASTVVRFTEAASDQEHLPMILLSVPSEITDRTDYLLGKTDVNPGYALAEQILRLEKAGATVAGMACNTVHSPRIFSVIQRELKRNNSQIHLIDLISLVIADIRSRMPTGTPIGILGTTGTYLSGLYTAPLIQSGYPVLDPGPERQDEWIQQAIYHPRNGIKSTATNVSPEALGRLQQAIDYFHDRTGGAILVGCSEITLAIDNVQKYDMQIIRPMDLLAKTLIFEYKKT